MPKDFREVRSTEDLVKRDAENGKVRDTKDSYNDKVRFTNDSIDKAIEDGKVRFVMIKQLKMEK